MDNFLSQITDQESHNVGVILVGSQTRKNGNITPSDKDYVIVGGENDISVISERIRSKQGCVVSDDSLLITDGDQDYGLCLLSVEKFLERINAVLSDNFIQKDWAIGLVMPEGFYGDIEKGIIELDTTDLLLQNTKNNINKEKFKTLQVLDTQTLVKLEGASSLIRKHAGDRLKYEIIKGQILNLLVRLFYLRNHEFCKGVKHYSRDVHLLEKGNEIVRVIDSIIQNSPNWNADLDTLILQ